MPRVCRRCAQRKSERHWYHGRRPRLIGLCRDCALLLGTAERRAAEQGGGSTGPLSLRREAARVQEHHDGVHGCGGGPVG